VSTGAAAQDRSTNRIVVPTDSNEMVRDTSNEERDEATIVRPRVSEERIDDAAVIFHDAPPPAETFNPWRIIVPAAIGLLVVFGVIWALTRNSNQPTTNQPTAPLTVDPGGQPVQPMQSPTGQGERGISASPTSNTTPNSNSTNGAGQNQTAQPSPSAENANSRHTENSQKNSNAKTPTEEQPEETPANDNKEEGRPSPTPKPSESPADSDEPPPVPTPKTTKKKPRELPKPTEVPVDTPAQPPAGEAQPTGEPAP
jgi:hypothetical protein